MTPLQPQAPFCPLASQRVIVVLQALPIRVTLGITTMMMLFCLQFQQPAQITQPHVSILKKVQEKNDFPLLN